MCLLSISIMLHIIQFAVRSSQFAVIHHTNRCWSLINCLFISCFFRIFRIKMTRGVEVLGRLRRTRNRCVFAVHAMPSYMPPYMPSSLWVFALSLIVIFLLIFLQNAERRRSSACLCIVARGLGRQGQGTVFAVHAMPCSIHVVHVVIHHPFGR